MIPKLIHYCWFGGKPLPDELAIYVASWRRFCPDYEIKIWNEDSFDVNSHVFTRTAYAKKKYAYVSDFVRAYALNKYGGIYLDTDVELKDNLDVFLVHEAFTGFEKSGLPFTALWAAIPYHSLTKKVLSYYDSREYIDTQETNTMSVSAILISEFGINADKNILQIGSDGINSVHVYPAEYFCLDLLPNFATHHFSGSWLGNKVVPYKDYLHAQYYTDQAFSLSEDALVKGVASSLSIKSSFKVLVFSFYFHAFPGILKRFIKKITN